MSSKQLSLVAQYDDLMRYCEQSIGGDLIEDHIRILLDNCEKQRLHCLQERNELAELKNNHSKALCKVKTLETTLKNVREAFKKELGQRERVQSEHDELLKKLNQIKDYLVEEDNQTKDITKESRSSLKEILSVLDQHKLTTVVEEEISNSDKSLSDIDYSKSDDNIIDNDFQMDVNLDLKGVEKMDTAPVFENADDFSMLNDTMFMQDDRITTPIKRTNSTRSGASVQSKMSTLSQTLMKQRQSNLPNELRVDNRLHQFVTKKIFKSEKCSVCSTALKFCSTAYHCRDCRAICHANCKEKVPLPCIPYVSRANIGKQGRLILISDYVQANCKPCVPALIVHCINELESRENGLKELGLYRICASEKEVKELKEKILKSKHGIPQLSDKTEHVLCNVMKKFLNQLDEALISRIVWRDFVEAVSERNLEERKTRIREAILNLPNANRDTLAFVILHLRRVIAEEKSNKMSAQAISKVFGPTILGYSIKDPPQMQLFEENKKQAIVVDSLLSLDDEFWQSILDMDINNHMNLSILSPGNTSICQFNTPESQMKGRASIGSRLCGGKVGSGTITPLRNKRSQRNFNLKPLF